jgi:hypothetical protein
VADDWPPITGATAFWLATTQPSAHRLRTGLAATLAAALIAGALSFIALNIVANVVIHVMHPTPAQMGVPTPLASAASFAGLAALGAISVLTALVGGMVALPVRYLQTRHVH